MGTWQRVSRSAQDQLEAAGDGSALSPSRGGGTKSPSSTVHPPSTPHHLSAVTNRAQPCTSFLPRKVSCVCAKHSMIRAPSGFSDPASWKDLWLAPAPRDMHILLNCSRTIALTKLRLLSIFMPDGLYLSPFPLRVCQV